MRLPVLIVTGYFNSEVDDKVDDNANEDKHCLEIVHCNKISHGNNSAHSPYHQSPHPGAHADSGQDSWSTRSAS
jgi:hypothetical protein